MWQLPRGWALVPTDHPINQTHEETSYNIRLVIHRVTLRASGGRLFVSCNILGAKWIDKAAGRSAIGKSSSATVRQALTSLSRRSVRLPIIRPSASEKAWPNARASSMPQIEDVYLKIAGDRDYQAALTKARHLPRSNVASRVSLLDFGARGNVRPASRAFFVAAQARAAA
jgi:hypothetical protein